MNTTYIVVAAVVAVVGWLAYTGTLSSWLGLAKVKTQDATKAASTAAEKARMRINQLQPLLDSLGSQMTDLDGKFGRSNGELNRAKADFDKERGELKDIVTAIASAQNIAFEDAKTSTNVTPDQAATRTKHVGLVQAAKAKIDAKQKEIEGISAQATKLHEQYAQAEGELNRQKNELPAIEARSIVIASKTTALDFAKKMTAFNDAATSGSDVQSDLDEAEAKVDAELNRAGATQSETEKAAAKARETAGQADVLKDL